GCANGYLLECCARWVAERGIRLELWGLDLSEKLVELAKARLPESAGNLFVGNGLTWTPPQRFDYVRTELVYVPAEQESEYVVRLLKEFLGPGGRLLVANYLEGEPDPSRGLLPGIRHTADTVQRLKDLGFQVTAYRDGLDPVKGRRTRVAIIGAPMSLT